MFCFGKFHFLLAVGDMLEQKRFQYPRFGLFRRQYKPPILGDIEIFLDSLSISTKPNDSPTTSVPGLVVDIS